VLAWVTAFSFLAQALARWGVPITGVLRAVA
jgi:hypothetical protein